MKKLAATVALALTLCLGVAAPAQASYNPWTTHTHCNSYGCYTNCSWWDSLWGCKNNVYYIVW